MELKVIQVSTHNGYQYQCLEITILNDSGRIQQDILRSLKLPPDLDLSQGVILGRACPTWLAGYLVERCQKEGGLMLVVVIHSVLEKRCDVLQTEPFW